METMESNKLIAEFMEYPNLGTEGDFSYLKYHKSWKWLMPVVEKIEDMGCEVVMTNGECTISADGYYGKSLGKSRRSATYDAVVKFIEWYNKNIVL